MSWAWRTKLIVTLGVAAAIAVGMEATQGSWSLATDVQKYYRCLPYDWYVVVPSGDDHEWHRGDLVQFTAPEYVERFTERFEVIKIVAAVAGDHWQILEDQLYINGELWGDLHLMSSIGAEPGSLDGEGTVNDGFVYVLGTNPSSYDSRYWGALPEELINGRAYVVL
jgi:conjugal transfer pilin signal peptidase TrbI